MLQYLYRAITKTYASLNPATSPKDYVDYIHANEAPPGTSYPLIVFNDVGSDTERTVCTRVHEYDIEFSVYSSKAEEAEFLGECLHKVYGNGTLPTEVGSIIACKRTGKRLEFDEVDNKFIFTGTYRYQMLESL